MTVAYRQTTLFKSHINPTSTTNEELICNQYYNNYLKELNHQDLGTTIINKLYELKYCNHIIRLVSTRWMIIDLATHIQRTIIFK